MKTATQKMKNNNILL